MSTFDWRRALPHRAPFLFIADVRSMDDHEIVALYRPPHDAPFFQGHFPGQPIFPAVLQCECALQSAAILLSKTPKTLPVDVTSAEAESPRLTVATRITDARFKRIVRPGDELTIRTRLDERLDNAAYLSSTLSVNGATASTLKIAVMLVENLDD